MATPPAPPAGLTAADYTVLRRVLAKLDRWYTPASGTSSPLPRSVIVQASGTTGSGIGVALSYANIARVALLVYSPSVATNLYVSTGEQFGVVNAAALSPQYGIFLAPGTYLSFGQEYAGPLYAYNTAAVGTAALDVRVLELVADPAFPPGD